jgi:Mor family transcriptional regulator
MLENESWVEDINIEELPEPYKTLAGNIGLRNTLKLADMYQGMAIYLPKLDGLIRRIRDEQIRKEFNGANYKEIALKYKLTEVWVRQIVNEGFNKDQISIFDI